MLFFVRHEYTPANMKHSKEKGRAPPKGRRRLEFGAPKQQLPLLNKAVYMDIKNSRQADFMEEQLKKLGARVEKFLSLEVNYVISSSGPSKPDEKVSREENPQSPSFVQSPFNCAPSPAVPPEAKTVVVSRGKALAQIACAKNKASSVVTSAEKLGIKVVSAEAATKWLEKELRKMKLGMESSVKENKSKKADVKLKESKTKSKLLTGSFIKFEDNSRHYRPVKVELDRWPRLNLTAPPGICPFGEAKVKVQNLYGARNHLPETTHVAGCGAVPAVAGCGAVPAVAGHAAPTAEEEEPKSVQKPAAQVELVGVPIATTGDAQRILNFQFKKNLAINKQQGYCDCCGVKFQNLDEHLKGEEHRSFARQKSNYESLDALISQTPSTVDFLQSVLLKHCVQRHEEPTVSSCAPTQFVNLLAPISPLTTEKTNVPSQEAATTCLKTPDPSGQEIATLKEQLTVTDTDLISKRDLVTPTKQKSPVDSRPQAVVIRRPMPSGMFTSPRRRPVTPSKKPWMQERSMVFSDSPIGSLQPSPCNSKDTPPNFLCDNAINSLNRLASVCDKNQAVQPNCMPEGSKATKNLFSIILNKNFSELRKKKSVTAQLDKKVTDACQTIVTDQQEKEIQSCQLEAGVTDAEGRNTKHSDNQNITTGDDNLAALPNERRHSLEQESAAPCHQLPENMIGKESEMTDSCNEAMTAEQKSELHDIHNEECSTLNMVIALSHHTNNLEEQVKDSKNKSIADVGKEMEFAVSIHTDCVNVEQEREVRDLNQEIEVTAKQQQRAIDSSLDNGLSVEQQIECTGFINKNIMTIEQANEETDCNQDKDMTAKQKRESSDPSLESSKSVGQEMEATGSNEFVTVKQEVEKTQSGHDRVVTVKKVIENAEYGHARVVTVEMEKTVSNHARVVTAEKEIERTTFGHVTILGVEQGKEVAGSKHETIVMVEQGKMEVTESSLDNGLTVEQEQEMRCLSHGNIVISQQEQEMRHLSHGSIVISQQEQEMRRLSHGSIVISQQEQEMRHLSHGNIVISQQEQEMRHLSHGNIVISQQEQEMRHLSHGNIVISQQEQEMRHLSHGNIVISQQEQEMRPLSHGSIVISQQEQEMRRLSHGSIVISQQEQEMRHLSHGSIVISQQEQEMRRLSHGNIVISQQEMKCLSHGNIVISQQEQEMVSDPENNITIRQEKEETGFSHDDSITTEEAKKEMMSSHNSNITVQREKEEIGLSHDHSFTPEQEKKETGSSHDININTGQEKEEIELSHDHSLSPEQEKKETGSSHDISITIGEEKEKIELSHDHSLTPEQEKKEKAPSKNCITVQLEKEETTSSNGTISIEQEKEVTGFSHDHSCTIVREKEEMGFSHDHSCTIEREKEEMGFSHDHSCTIVREKEEMGFSHDHSCTIVREKEVTGFCCCNNISGEQDNEVILFSCDNSNTIEQEKVAFVFSCDSSNVEEGKGCCNNKIMTAKNKFFVTEMDCESITTEQKDINVSNPEKSLAIEETIEKKDPSHKDIVTSDEVNSEGNSSGEKHHTFVDKADKLTNDANCEEIIKTEQTYNSDKNIIEKEVEEKCSNLEKKTFFMLKQEETGSIICRGRTDNQDIEENSCSHDKMGTVDGKPETNLNQGQMEEVDKEKVDSSLDYEKQTTVFEQNNEMVCFSLNKDVPFEQEDVVTNSGHEKRKVVGQEKEERNVNLGNSVVVKNVTTVGKYDIVVNISNQDKCEVVALKEKKRSDVEKTLTDELGNGTIAVEENKKEKVNKYEKDGSVERRKERKRSNYEKDKSAKKEMTVSASTVDMTLQKGKERIRSSHDIYISAGDKKSPIDSKYDEHIHAGNNEAKNSSDCGKINDDQRNNTSIPCHKESTVEGTNRKVRVLNCDKDKSDERRKERKSSNHAKQLATEEKYSKEPEHGDYTVDESKDKKSSHHEQVLIDEQRNQKKGFNVEKDKSVERRKERKSSSYDKQLAAEEKYSKDCYSDEYTTNENKKSSHHEQVLIDEQRNQKKGFNVEKDKSVERRKERKSSSYDKQLATEEKYSKEPDHDDYTLDESKDKKSSHHEQVLIDEQRNQKKGFNVEKDKSVERRKERKSSSYDKQLATEEKYSKEPDHDDYTVDESKDKKSSHHEQVLIDEQRNQKKGSNVENDKSVERRKERKSSSYDKQLATEEKYSKEPDHDDYTLDESKDKKSSHHEQVLIDEQRNQKKGFNVEKDKSVERRKERKSSSYDKQLAAEEKYSKDCYSDEYTTNENKKSSHHEEVLIDEQRNQKKGSNVENDKSVERRKERKSSSYDKQLAAEEKYSKDCYSDEYTTNENKYKKSSHHEQVLIDEQRSLQKGSVVEKDKSVERREKNNRSSQGKGESEEKEMKGICKDVEKRMEKKRSDHGKHVFAEEMKIHVGSKHDGCKKEKETCDNEKILINEPNRRNQDSSDEKYIAMEEKKKAKASNCKRDESIERKQERKSSNNEKGESEEENELKSVDCKEKRKERKSSNREKGESEDNTLKSVDCKEKRKERKSFNSEKGESVKENEPKSVDCKEKRKERKSSNNENGESVKENEPKSVNCKEKRKERKQSSHEKQTSDEEKKNSKDSKLEQSVTVENNKEKNSFLYYEKETTDGHQKLQKDLNLEEKSDHKQKERKRSSHKKHASSKEKSIQDSVHDKSIAIESNKEKDSCQHEQGLTDEHRSPQKVSDHEIVKPLKKRKEGKRSSHEKDTIAEEIKSHIDSKHNAPLGLEYKKEKYSSLHEKELTDKHRSLQKVLDLEDKSVEKRKDRKRSKHEKHRSVEERNSKDSKHDESIATVEDRDSSLHEKGLIDESVNRDKDSSHEKGLIDEAVVKDFSREKKSEDKKKITACNHRADKSVERNKERRSSNHEKHLSSEERLRKDEHIAVDSKERSYNHDKHLSTEESMRKDEHIAVDSKERISNHDKHLSSEERIRKDEHIAVDSKERIPNHEKHLSSEERKRNDVLIAVDKKEKSSSNRDKHLFTEEKTRKGEHIAVDSKEMSSNCDKPLSTNDRKRSQEKGLADEQRRQQKGSKHECDKFVEKREERKSSNHDKQLFTEEKMRKDEHVKNKERGRSQETGLADEHRQQKGYKHKDDKCVEKREDRNSSNHYKHLFTDEKKRRDEHIAAENKDRKRSHEKELPDERQQTDSKHKDDKYVEKREDRKSSNHGKGASNEGKEMKSSNCKKVMAVDKRKERKKCDPGNKQFDSSHDKHITRNDNESSYHDRISIDEPKNRKKSSSPVKFVSTEEQKKAKVSDCETDQSGERLKEHKITNCEKSLSLAGKEITDSNGKEGIPVERRRDRRGSKHGKKSAEEKKRNEEHIADEHKEIKSSHWEKELTDEKRIQQEEDERKERKRSHEKHATEEMNKGLDIKHDHKEKYRERSVHENRLIDEPRNRKESFCHGKHKGLKENLPEVSICEKGKSDERKNERTLSGHERSLSVEEKKSTPADCKDDTTVEIRKKRKRSKHEKYSSSEAKKTKKDDYVENASVEKIANKNSDHKNRNVQQEKYRQDSDNNTSFDIGRKTQPNLNPVVLISGSEIRQCIASDSLAKSVYKHLAGQGLGAQACNLIYVASHKDSINNMLLKEGQISCQIRRDIDSSSAHNSTDTAVQGLIKNKNGHNGPHKSEDGSSNKNGSKLCSDVDSSKMCKDVDSSKMCKDIHASKMYKDIDASKMCKDVCASKICKDVNSSKIGKDASHSKIGKDVDCPEMCKDVICPKIGKDIDVSKSGKDIGSYKMVKDDDGSKISRDVCGSKIGKDVKKVYAEDTVKSNKDTVKSNKDTGKSNKDTVTSNKDKVKSNKETVKSNKESNSIRHDTSVKADIYITKTSDKTTCVSSLVGLSNTDREPLLKDQTDISETKTRKPCGKDLQKRSKDFEADKKACTVEKYVEKDGWLSLQGVKQVFEKVGEIYSLPNNTGVENPNTKQSLEVESVSVPGGSLNEVIGNSQDSYMDEDTVDIDFYESYTGNRQSNIVDTVELHNVHAVFPYISEKVALNTEPRHFHHITGPTSSPCATEQLLPQLLTTEPRPFSPSTDSVKAETAIKVHDCRNSDHSLSQDTSFHHQRSTCDLDKCIKGSRAEIPTENRNKCSYKNSLTSTGTHRRQIYSERSLELNVQQKDAIEANSADEENISASREIVGQLSRDALLSEEMEERTNAASASDEVSTLSITSCATVVGEQSKHHLSEGLVNESNYTDSLPSSENMQNDKGDSDEDIDFVEPGYQSGNVVVPNIADRVKSRSRIGCPAPPSADPDRQGCDEEKKARRKRKKAFREKHQKHRQDSIDCQRDQQMCDTSPKMFARNVISNSGDKRHKNSRKQKSNPAAVVPNIAESVTNRRSCTFFNHPGQYANSGEGSDGEDENLKVESRSAQKSRHKKYTSRERNLKALSTKSEVDYDKHGLVKHSRILYSQNRSVDVKVENSSDVRVGSSVDVMSEVEANGKTSNLSESLCKTEDEASDLSSAVVVRRRKNYVYPSNKRPEVDWGKVQQSEGSSEQDRVEDSLLTETPLVADKNKTCEQSDSVLKSSGQRRSHSITGSQVSPLDFLKEAKVVLVDINTSPYASTHIKESLSLSHIHTEASTSAYLADIPAKSSASSVANIHTCSPTSHYPATAHIKTSTIPSHTNIHTSSPTSHYPATAHIKTSTIPSHTNIHVKTPTSCYIVNDHLAVHRSRLKTVKPSPARSICELPSSPGISCSPRLRLKIRRRSGNKGFSSTLEEIHDCLSVSSVDCGAQADTEHCDNSCEQNIFEEKYKSRIYPGESTGPPSQQCMDRGCSSDMSGSLPPAQYVDRMQSVSDVKSSKRKRAPDTPDSSDSESTLEYPLSFASLNKRIKVSPGNWAHLDIDNSKEEDQNAHKEISPCISGGGASALVQSNNIRSCSPNRQRSSSPCFSSPVTTRHFQCFTTPKKSHVPDKPAAGSESPVFNLSKHQLRHMQSLLHSGASSLQQSRDSTPPMMSSLTLKNAGLEANVMLDSSLKHAAGRHASVKRLLSQQDLDFPSAKKTKVDSSLCLTADRSSVPLLESKQLVTPFDNFAEPSGRDFCPLFQAASKLNPALDLNQPVNHISSSFRTNASDHGITSALPLAGTSRSHRKHFDNTERVTSPAMDRSMKRTAVHFDNTERVASPAMDRSMKRTAVHFDNTERVTSPAMDRSLKRTAVHFDNTERVTSPAMDRSLKRTAVHSHESDEEMVMLFDIDCFSGVSESGFEDLLNQVTTFSSPDKASDTSWGDICDNYLSTSFNNHNTQTSGQPVRSGIPAGRETRSPHRKQLKHHSSPLRRTVEESMRGQSATDNGRIHKQKTTVSRYQANCSRLDTADQQELLTPVKKTSIKDSNLSPHIQQVDDDISFNFMSPQRLKSSTHDSSMKFPSSPQSEHQRSCITSHSRRLFSPAKTSSQRVNSSPHQTQRSSTQSLLSPPREQQRSHTQSHSRRLFSPTKLSTEPGNCSPHQTHRSSTQALPKPQAHHQRSHTASHRKHLFSPAKTSAADQLL